MLPSLYILPSDAALVLVVRPRLGVPHPLLDPASRLLPPMRDEPTIWLVSSERDGVLVYVVVSKSIGLDEWIRVEPCKIRELYVPNPFSSLDRVDGPSPRSCLFGIRWCG